MNVNQYFTQVLNSSVLDNLLNTSNCDEKILELDELYCSHGDTVHYDKNPKVFSDCEGSFMFDAKDTPYLDLQMMYSACNFGYKNKRVTDAVIDQMQTLPQLTPKFIQPYKSLLSEKMARMIEKRC